MGSNKYQNRAMSTSPDSGADDAGEAKKPVRAFSFSSQQHGDVIVPAATIYADTQEEAEKKNTDRVKEFLSTLE